MLLGKHRIILLVESYTQYALPQAGPVLYKFSIYFQSLTLKHFWLTHFSLICLSYRNQSFDLPYKSNDWFLYEMQHQVFLGIIFRVFLEITNMFFFRIIHLVYSQNLPKNYHFLPGTCAYQGARNVSFPETFNERI